MEIFTCNEIRGEDAIEVNFVTRERLMMDSSAYFDDSTYHELRGKRGERWLMRWKML